MRAALAVLVAALALACPTTAAAHAQLESTDPERGATLERQPRVVSFTFSEPVEGAFGALRVFDAGGERVDDGQVVRPGGGPERIGVGLRPDLPSGAYTATYRVVSADSHVIAGGFVFTLRIARTAPESTVAELIEEGEAGAVSDFVTGLFRVLFYAALALAVGGLVFYVAVWRPVSVAGRTPTTGPLGLGGPEATETVIGRLRVVFLLAAAMGALGAAGGIVMQGAEAAGVSGFEALRPSILTETLETRFGTYRGLAIVAWLAFAAITAALVRPTPSPMGRFPAYMFGNRPIGSVVAVAAPLAFLVCVPALCGHASVQPPVAVLFPANVIHVTAMATWLGGLAVLVYAVPVAVRRLSERIAGPDYTNGVSRFLITMLPGFSRIALVAVALLALTGLVQAYVLVRDPADLLDTAYGRAVLAKFALLTLAVAIAAYMRRRALPRLRESRFGEPSQPRAVAAARRGIATEVGLLVVVLGVTAALASYTPPIAAQAGPYTARAVADGVLTELTVDPARPGPNEVHLYLFDARTGAQFDAAEEVTASASLPGEEIGPLELNLRPAGPGHYLAPDASLAVEGEWQLTITTRTSAFNQQEAGFQVPIE